MQTRRPFYGAYAWAYDLIIDPPTADVCDGIAALYSERGVTPGAHVLDAGCGTGAYAVELAKRGYHVSGVDVSPELIEQARKKSTGLAPIEFEVGDILDVSGDSAYDGILCRGVLNDLTSDVGRDEVFRAFARLLGPSGTLLLDVREWGTMVAEKTENPVFERSVSTERGLLTFRSHTRLDHANRQLLVTERHTLTHGGEHEVAYYDCVMRCWTKEEIESQLQANSFIRVTYLADYALKHRTRSDRLFVAATRS